MVSYDVYREPSKKIYDTTYTKNERNTNKHYLIDKNHDVATQEEDRLRYLGVSKAARTQLKLAIQDTSHTLVENNPVRLQMKWASKSDPIIRELILFDLIFSRDPEGFYWLSLKGVKSWKKLNSQNPPTKKSGYLDDLLKDTAVVPTPKPKCVDYYLDVDVNRDGIAVTITKWFWRLKNRDDVKAFKLAKFASDFASSQKAIEKSLANIQDSQQRVSEKLIEQGPPVIESTWSEKAQREQNDLYWMAPSAFWLNPNGPLAEPVPAPDWWSPPINYTPKTGAHLARLIDNDVVTKSLQPPEVQFNETYEPHVSTTEYQTKKRSRDEHDDMEHFDDSNWYDVYDDWYGHTPSRVKKRNKP